MKTFLLSILGLVATVTFAQTTPTLKLLHTYTEDGATGARNFGSDLFINNNILYVSARNDLARYVNSYSISSDGSLSFIKKIEEKDSKMYGYSISASDDYIVSISSSEKVIFVYPQNGSDAYKVTLTGTAPAVSQDGNTLIATSNGQTDIYKITDTALEPLYSMPSSEAKFNIGTKPAIKGNVAAVCDRTNKKVIIFEKTDGSWSKTSSISIPNGTTNLFGLAIGDGHIFAGDRGLGQIFDIVKQNGSWTIRQTISDGEGTSLGSFLAYDNGYLVAICNYTTKSPFNNSYVFKQNADGNWSKAYIIENSDDLRLAHVVAISDMDIYISQYNYGVNGVVTVGAVFHYRLDTFENTTPIRKIENDNNTNTDIYDLQGRRIMGTPQKGLYIKNGKLISVK